MLEQAEKVNKPKTTEIILGSVGAIILIVVIVLIVKKRKNK